MQAHISSRDAVPPAYGDYQLGDNEYRRFLKVKIAKSATSGTIASDEKASLQ